MDCSGNEAKLWWLETATQVTAQPCDEYWMHLFLRRMECDMYYVHIHRQSMDPRVIQNDNRMWNKSIKNTRHTHKYNSKYYELFLNIRNFSTE
jgi:hypothetical protein